MFLSTICKMQLFIIHILFLLKRHIYFSFTLYSLSSQLSTRISTQLSAQFLSTRLSAPGYPPSVIRPRLTAPGYPPLVICPTKFSYCSYRSLVDIVAARRPATQYKIHWGAPRLHSELNNFVAVRRSKNKICSCLGPFS